MTAGGQELSSLGSRVLAAWLQKMVLIRPSLRLARLNLFVHSCFSQESSRLSIHPSLRPDGTRPNVNLHHLAPEMQWIRDVRFEARGHPWGTLLALMLILSFHGTPSSCG